MEESIKKLNDQFTFQPKIENGENIQKKERLAIVGMGGSALAGDIAKIIWPELEITVHKDYGLPPLTYLKPEQYLILLISHSGNTEEILSSLVIRSGGELITKAREHKIPLIVIPNKGEQPRLAIPYILKSILKSLWEDEKINELENLSKSINTENHKSDAFDLAWKLAGHIPIIYTSNKNWPIAYNWKIKLNETAKIPAFYNTLPEANHNELEGFDNAETERKLLRPYFVIFLIDNDDSERIKKRFEIMKGIFTEKGIPVVKIKIQGSNKLEKFFNSLLFADWLSLKIAEIYKQSPDQVPLIEQFKEKLKQ